MFFKIENLVVSRNKKKILKGINLEVKRGETHALLGPNASGKSTFTQTIAGNSKYSIVEGAIKFKNRDITHTSISKRVKLGIVVSWQNPPAVPGVELFNLVKDNKKIINNLFITKLLDRDVNVGFSGGEKKISEIFQILSLNPSLVIFDEIDSGLDIERTKEIAKIIKEELIEKKVSVIIITHHGRILDFLEPDMTSVIIDGKIVCQNRSYKNILKIIQENNYEECIKCSLRTS